MDTELDVYNHTFNTLRGNFVKIPFNIGDRVIHEDDDEQEGGYHIVSGIRFIVTYSSNKTEASYEYLLDNAYGYRIYNSTELTPYIEKESESPTEE